MRVAVAMSGGVDSSVAALLLKEQGHEVFGVSMQLYEGPSAGARRCCGVTDIADARRVAGVLGIPFYVCNMKQLFRERVMDPFVRSYLSGTTPIPCVACNADLKFRTLLQRVRAMGAEALATGHYARIEAGGDRRRLLKALDRDRDQSYFLYHLDQEQLAQLLFPLGRLAKAAVRERARAAGLPVCDKPDSQEICFVPDGDYAAFVTSQTGCEPGEISDSSGTVLGRHEGIHRYTVGQRRGLGLAGGEPRYVLRIDAATRSVVVGPERELLRRRCHVSDLRWTWRRDGRSPLRAAVRIRSRHREAKATIEPEGPGANVRFDEPQKAIAPGQAAVFYEGDEVLGGGTVSRLDAGA